MFERTRGHGASLGKPSTIVTALAIQAHHKWADAENDNSIDVPMDIFASLLPPIAATLVFFLWNVVVRHRGRLWVWANFYFGPVLTGSYAAFLVGQLYERLEALQQRCDVPAACETLLDTLIQAGILLPSLITVVAWLILGYIQIWIWRSYQDHSSLWIRNLWLLGVSNIVGLIAYGLYIVILSGQLLN